MGIKINDEILPIKYAPEDELVLIFVNGYKPFTGYVVRNPEFRIIDEDNHLKAENFFGSANIKIDFDLNKVVGFKPIIQTKTNDYSNLVKKFS